jgi:hypothetical protein
VELFSETVAGGLPSLDAKLRRRQQTYTRALRIAEWWKIAWQPRRGLFRLSRRAHSGQRDDIEGAPKASVGATEPAAAPPRAVTFRVPVRRACGVAFAQPTHPFLVPFAPPRPGRAPERQAEACAVGSSPRGAPHLGSVRHLRRVVFRCCWQPRRTKSPRKLRGLGRGVAMVVFAPVGPLLTVLAG